MLVTFTSIQDMNLILITNVFVRLFCVICLDVMFGTKDSISLRHVCFEPITKQGLVNFVINFVNELLARTKKQPREYEHWL